MIDMIQYHRLLYLMAKRNHPEILPYNKSDSWQWMKSGSVIAKDQEFDQCLICDQEINVYNNPGYFEHGVEHLENSGLLAYL